MNGEGDVTQHRDYVRHGQAGQDLVDRCPHVSSGQYGHIESVGYYAAHAHEQREVAVVAGVPLRELLELRVDHLTRVVVHREVCLGQASHIVLQVPGTPRVGGGGGERERDKEKTDIK